MFSGSGSRSQLECHYLGVVTGSPESVGIGPPSGERAENLALAFMGPGTNRHSSTWPSVRNANPYPTPFSEQRKFEDAQGTGSSCILLGLLN